jgi:hypothetical protein
MSTERKLTEEEKAKLEIDRANAKVRCGEVWGTLCKLEKEYKKYLKIHNLWKSRFEKADRTLAMDKRIIYKLNDRRTSNTYNARKLTKSDLKDIMKELKL